MAGVCWYRRHCFLRLGYQVRVVDGGSQHITIEANQEQICQDGGSHEDFTGWRSGHSSPGGRNSANQFNLFGNVGVGDTGVMVDNSERGSNRWFLRRERRAG